MNVSSVSKKPPAKPPAAPPKPSKFSEASMTRGIYELPLRVVLYGPEGIGKSTFASRAPDPVWLGADKGTQHLNIARLPKPDNWGEVLEGVRFAIRARPRAISGRPMKTLVIDPVNWFEALLFARLCKDNGWTSIEDPGFGKGYTAAVDQWRILRDELERAVDNGINVILIAHADKKNEKNPDVEDFERYIPKLNKYASGLLKEWADYVFFARRKVWTKKGEDKRVRGASDGTVLMHTAWMPAYDAKSRPQLPPVLPLSWRAFIDARAAISARLTELRAEFDRLIGEIGDSTVEAQARDYIKDSEDDASILEEVIGVLSAELDKRTPAEGETDAEGEQKNDDSDAADDSAKS